MVKKITNSEIINRFSGQNPGSGDEPISGVSIRLDDRVLTSSGDNGSFQIRIPKGSRVGFEMIGYESLFQILPSA